MAKRMLISLDREISENIARLGDFIDCLDFSTRNSVLEGIISSMLYILVTGDHAEGSNSIERLLRDAIRPVRKYTYHNKNWILEQGRDQADIAFNECMLLCHEFYQRYRYDDLIIEDLRDLLTHIDPYPESAFDVRFNERIGALMVEGREE